MSWSMRLDHWCRCGQISDVFMMAGKLEVNPSKYLSQGAKCNQHAFILNGG